MNRNFWFYAYLIMGIVMGVSAELINHFNGSVAGIGMIIYFLIMITYFQIFGRDKR